MAKKTSGTYVIGHINPDTDSIASAMGYAWLLQNQTGETITPARAGHLNPQTAWVLERLHLEPPALLPDASPRFENVVQRLNTTTPERPLRELAQQVERAGRARADGFRLQESLDVLAQVACRLIPPILLLGQRLAHDRVEVRRPPA